MADSIKVCPICSASNHRNATVCWNCGTSLAGIEVQLKDDTSGTRPSTSQYDFRYGETDLYENAIFGTGQRYLLGCFGFVAAIMILGIGLAVTPTALNAVQDLLASDPNTPTSAPQYVLPTTTEGPPTLTPSLTVAPTLTPSITPTREPCLQEAQPGDFMYDLVNRCGHFSADVYDEVVEINNLDSAAMIIAGQVYEIPWPTPTVDPNAQPANATNDESSSAAEVASGSTDDQTNIDVLALSDEELEDVFVISTPTLPPGIQWHTVQAGESVVSIVVQYNASVQVLRDLNPELTFTQCNMGFTFGGENCNVIINQGQQIRVPGPTPMPTLSPTPNGSETSTPTPTATFNAPIAQSPADRAVFRANELITLRWLPTGTLSDNETYRVVVEDRNAGILYSADTIETFYIVPQAWQGIIEELPEDQPHPRHDYLWHVSVISFDNPDNPTYQTTPQAFSWEARVQN